MRIRDQIHERWFMFLAMLFSLAGFLSDELSSRNIPDFAYETNFYARDTLGRFVWSHAVAYDFLQFLLMFTVGSIMYIGIRKLSEIVAQSAFAAWFLLFGVDSFMAAIHNVWLRLGWYIPDSLLK